MTGFLARMAARAAGGPAGGAAGAAPRVPARFEGPAAWWSPAPARQALVAGSGPVATPGPGTAPQPVATPAAVPGAPVAAPRTADELRPAEMGVSGARTATSARPRRSPRDPDPGTRFRAAEVPDGAELVAPTRPTAGRAPVGAAVAANAPHPGPGLVAAVPVLAAALRAAPAPAPGDRASSERREPDVVRVTIDRVEIRAAVAPPAPRPAPTADRRPMALPLGDYLRGRRGAG